MDALINFLKLIFNLQKLSLQSYRVVQWKTHVLRAKRASFNQALVLSHFNWTPGWVTGTSMFHFLLCEGTRLDDALAQLLKWH